MQNLILEYIRLILEKRASFNPRALSQLSPEELLQYVAKFEYVAEGSARRVYIISPSRVLKVARNSKGIAQNEAEIQASNAAGEAKAILPKIFDYDKENNLWILVESVKEFNSKKEFESMTDVDYDRFATVINRFVRTKELSEEDTENPFLRHVTNLMDKFHLVPGDLILSHFGKTADGRVALLDYGFTKDVFLAHYKGAVRDQSGFYSNKACDHEGTITVDYWDDEGLPAYVCDACEESVESCIHYDKLVQDPYTKNWYCDSCDEAIPMYAMKLRLKAGILPDHARDAMEQQEREETNV